MHCLRRFRFLTILNTSCKLPVAANSTSVDNNTGKEVEVKSWRKIPGPPSFTGYIYYLFRKDIDIACRDNDDMITRLYEQYGPIVKVHGTFGTPNNIFIFDAEAASHILRSENVTPVREGFYSLDYFRKKYKKSSSDNHMDKTKGLITDQGDMWRKTRSTVNPILLRPQTIKLYDGVLNEIADDMIKRMRFIRNENNMLEGKFDEEMNLWALESIAVVALGTRLNCFDMNLTDDSPAKEIIQTVHDLMKMLQDIDFYPNLWRYFSTPLFKQSMKLYEKHATLGKYYIEKAKKLNDQRKTTTNEKSVLDKLLDIDDHVATVMSSDLLFSGVDTVAYTMIFTLYLLAKNPHKQNILREEIMSDSEKRPYLKACIKEAMRILPVVNVNARTTTKEYDVLGYRIPKDMYVIFGHRLLSTMEEHFPRPMEYIPERWITDKSDPLHYGNAHPFAFSPFGFGVRTCIGRRIAELELEVFLAKIIKNFHVEWFGEPLKIKPVIVNCAEPPFNFVFRDVK